MFLPHLCPYMAVVKHTDGKIPSRIPTYMLVFPPSTSRLELKYRDLHAVDAQWDYLSGFLYHNQTLKFSRHVCSYRSTVYRHSRRNSEYLLVHSPISPANCRQRPSECHHFPSPIPLFSKRAFVRNFIYRIHHFLRADDSPLFGMLWVQVLYRRELLVDRLRETVHSAVHDLQHDSTGRGGGNFIASINECNEWFHPVFIYQTVPGLSLLRYLKSWAVVFPTNSIF
jgi:hypothetical protein